MSSRIPNNVKRGVQFLDERLPGWRKHVDSEELDLGNVCNCVLGQTMGDYDDALDLLGLTDREARGLGFHEGPHQTFDLLTQAWRKVLAK